VDNSADPHGLETLVNGQFPASEATSMYILTPTVLPSPPESLCRPLDGDRNLLNFKTLLLCNLLNNMGVGDEVKVGLVTSRSSAGRAAQSIGSFVVPGDMGDIRSPVRSTVYETLTPGGGGGKRNRRLLGASIGRRRDVAVRCPSGFEFGGRFATRGFGNCGRRLFDVPGGGGGRSGTGGAGLVGLLRADRRRVGSGNYEGRVVQVQRNAQIARVAGANESKFDAGVNQAVTALANPDTTGTLLVRRDGQVLQAAVSPQVLAGINNNPDMKDGALVSAVASPAALGENEVPTLWRSGIRSVALAFPGGGSIRVNRARGLTGTEKRRLARAWAKATNESDGDYDYGLRLRQLVENSNNLLSYEENFPNLKNASDLVTIAEANNDDNQMTVRRWVLNTYLSDNAPDRKANSKTWREVEAANSEATANAEKIPDADAAIAHLKGGGAVDEVPSRFLNEALEKSKAFRVTKVRPGVSILERKDEKWWRLEGDGLYSHLGERVSSDVQGALGLTPTTVKFIGEGETTRDVLVSHPETAGKTARQLSVAQMSPKDLLRVTVADWLVDHRDRNPASLMTIGSDSNSRIIPTGNAQSGLAGLSKNELEARRRLVLGDFLGQSMNQKARERFESLANAQRKIVLDIYNDLLERASKFNWDDYMSRVGLDGGLSAGEKAHLDLVKRLYERRLQTLRSSRQKFLTGMGLN
jgi:hypothetical protein